MKKSILWAVDPLTEGARSAATKRILRWFDLHHMPVQAAHVVAEIDQEALADIPRAALAFREAAARDLDQYLHDEGVGNIDRVLLTGARNRLRQKVALWEKFAGSEGAPLTLLCAHGRAGLSRAFLGSFAERLLLETKRPILFLPKRPAASPGRLNRILFATDFSPHSREAYFHLLPLAKKLNSQIILCHILKAPPMSMGIAVADVPIIIPKKFYMDMERWGKSMLNRWVAQAEAFGVDARPLYIPRESALGFAQSVLREAKRENAGILAVAHARRSQMDFVLGSVARDLIQESRLPLWICGPHCTKRSAREIWGQLPAPASRSGKNWLERGNMAHFRGR